MSNIGDNRPDYAEPLPDQCPPKDAVNLSEGHLIRLWEDPTPTAHAFLSYAALGKPVRGTVSPCAYASCSMYSATADGVDDQLRALRALPKLRRFTHAFLVAVNDKAGMGLPGRQGHVDTWLFRSFNPVAAVAQVRQF